MPSMGRAGSTYDNALAESFVATLKTELLYPQRLAYPAGGENGDLRVHRGLLQHPQEALPLRHLSPTEFEEVRLEEMGAA